MTGDDAREYVKTLTEQERRVLGVCSKRKSFGYQSIAAKLGLEYSEVQSAGQTLTGMNLAAVEPVRMGNEFAGSAIFLNDRGEQVKTALPQEYVSETNAKN